MLRAIVAILLGLLGTGVNAESFARDAQTLISNLGYKIVVDGAWGRNSNATLAKLYSDYGALYDGHLDQEEMAFLAELTANAPDYIHPRSHQVDYSIKYEFPAGNFPTYNLNDYRAKFIETYGQKYFRKDQIDYSFGPACMELYHYYDIYENINITDGPPTRQFNLTMPTYLCFAEMGDAVDQDFIVNGRDSEPLRIFFEELVPAWIENDAFSAEGMTSRFNGNDTRPVFTATQIVSIYTMYGKWWGVSAEMDAEFREWFDKNTEHSPSGFNRADFSACKEFAGPGPGTNDGHLGWCMNEGANFSVALAYMGRYYKDSDYINEAIYTASMIAKTSSPDAIHLDHVRGGYGLGYAFMTLHRLNDIAMLLDDVGVNFYDMQVATHGRTLRDMINVFAHEAVFPDLTFKYSCNDEEMFNREHKVYCHRQIYDSDSYKLGLASWFRNLAGPLINNPEFQPFIEITEPWPEIAHPDGVRGRQNVGFDHWMQFNEYVVIKYFPPINQFYLNDPNADRRPNVRGDMSADEWIEMATELVRQQQCDATIKYEGFEPTAGATCPPWLAIASNDIDKIASNDFEKVETSCAKFDIKVSNISLENISCYANWLPDDYNRNNGILSVGDKFSIVFYEIDRESKAIARDFSAFFEIGGDGSIFVIQDSADFSVTPGDIVGRVVGDVLVFTKTPRVCERCNSLLSYWAWDVSVPATLVDNDGEAQSLLLAHSLRKVN